MNNKSNNMIDISIDKDKSQKSSLYKKHINDNSKVYKKDFTNISIINSHTYKDLEETRLHDFDELFSCDFNNKFKNIKK